VDSHIHITCPISLTKPLKAFGNVAGWKNRDTITGTFTIKTEERRTKMKDKPKSYHYEYGGDPDL
jgi:hypothetical protein